MKTEKFCEYTSHDMYEDAGIGCPVCNFTTPAPTNTNLFEDIVEAAAFAVTFLTVLVWGTTYE